MIKQLLEEVRTTELDEPSRERLQAIYETLDQRAGLGAVARPARRARPAGAALRRRRRCRATSSCAWPRPSSSAGSRGCSTASRPRCSPSRWRPASSSRTCAASCPPGPAASPPGHLPVSAGSRPGGAAGATSPQIGEPARISTRVSQSAAESDLRRITPCNSSTSGITLWIAVEASSRGASGRRGRFVHPPPRPHRVLDARRRGPGRRRWWPRPRPTASRRSASPTTATCTASSTSTRRAATRASSRSSAPSSTWPTSTAPSARPAGAASTTRAARPRAAARSTTT